jgi:hypothetical protein
MTNDIITTFFVSTYCIHLLNCNNCNDPNEWMNERPNELMNECQWMYEGEEEVYMKTRLIDV